MVVFAREASSRTKPLFERIGRPYSFFDFREKKFGELDPLGRLLSQVRRLDAHTMVVEDLSPMASKDLIEENEDIKIRLGTAVASRILRLTFFKSVIRTSKALDVIEANDFVGYVIIKEDTAGGAIVNRRVYESVLSSSHHQNNFVRGAPIWSCKVHHRRFRIRGHLYAQQNALTNVCAHAALRTAASVFHPDGDMSYRAMNDVLGIDHKSNWVGQPQKTSEGNKGHGLSVSDMVKVLNEAGARCIQADYSLPPVPHTPAPPPYQRYVYASIESGFPAVLVFDTSDPHVKHAVPVFGHTLNQDLWVPNAERRYFKLGESTQYLPSDSWLSSFIVHDDNWGSNFCCPKHFLKPLPLTASGNRSRRNPATNSEWVAHVIATVPKDIILNPLHAEAMGVDFLFAVLPDLPSDGNMWGQRLMNYAEKGLMVFRPVLITGREYADHLLKIRGWQGTRVPPSMVSIIRTALAMEKYWMVEMSVPELFSSNLRKLGEVLLRVDHAPRHFKRDFTCFVMARLPGHFAVRDTSLSAKFRFIPSPVESHVKLFGLKEDPRNSSKRDKKSVARQSAD